MKKNRLESFACKCVCISKDALLLACVWPCQDEQNAQHKTAISGLVLFKKTSTIFGPAASKKL
jgi:hypothetical protein